MNRYRGWKYAIMLIAVLLGLTYVVPNFFGEVPSVQISPGKSTVKLDEATRSKVEQAFSSAGVQPLRVTSEPNSIKATFESPELQLKARDAVQRVLNPDLADPAYIVALNFMPRTPTVLQSIGAKPMTLGLDLRGGVHFLLQVDMKSALNKRADALVADVRSALREKDIRHSGISRNGEAVEVLFAAGTSLDAVRKLFADQFSQLQFVEAPEGANLKFTGTLRPEAQRAVQEQALKQNVTTLHNRINELGVAEPVIQQQGLDRIVVELPGVQDPTRAKEILGRTATLEVRMVDGAADPTGTVPFGDERFLERRRDGSTGAVIVKRQVVLTGDRITGASSTFDQNQRPAVSVDLDSQGGNVMKAVTRENIGKPMAMILFERGKGEVISVANIQGEFSNRFQITGSFTSSETNNLALLLRAGSLAAPMEIIEEVTVGPSLGAENIQRGFDSVKWGFLVIVLFMTAYYALFGLISGVSLGVNLLLLVGIFSALPATLTLPGMAAIALALGMAIDSNVLINERIREELRGGASPQAAINAGYDRAWATILDSNVTTLIAGVALFAFGSGPIRGFAAVHCIGILTSMFSAVFFSRGLVNLWYGRQKKLKSVSIGTVWRPEPDGAVTKAERG